MACCRKPDTVRHGDGLTRKIYPPRLADMATVGFRETVETGGMLRATNPRCELLDEERHPARV